MTSLTLARLTQAVQSDAAFRRIRRLQPVGGVGDKIFPPTFPAEGRNQGPRHVFEYRRVDGHDVLCVLVDGVASQANRLEEALRGQRESGRVKFPVIAVDFAKTDVADIGRVSTLEAPHRVFDAIIRDSEAKGVKFKETPEGEALIRAKSGSARALFDLSPTALLFGAWNSTGEGGGLGAKFPRAVVSEIVGVGVAQERTRDGEVVASGKRVGSRIDPLGIRSVKVWKRDGEWTTEPPAKATKDVKEVRASEINHSNIRPSVESLGVSCDHIVHTFVLSCAALRRLQVVPDASEDARTANAATRAVLATLGLVAAVAQDAAGYFLRSRCDLVPEAASSGFEIVKADGTVESITIELEGACALLTQAVEAAAKRNVAWRASDLVLTPQKKLVDLVRVSREKALKGESEETDDTKA